MDLRGQLSGRAEDERLCLSDLNVERLKNGGGKRGGLSGPGLRLGDHVTPC